MPDTPDTCGRKPYPEGKNCGFRNIRIRVDGTKFYDTIRRMETKQVYPVVLQLAGLSSQQNQKLIKNDNIQWDGLLTVTIEQLTMKVRVVIGTDKLKYFETSPLGHLRTRDTSIQTFILSFYLLPMLKGHLYFGERETFFLGPKTKVCLHSGDTLTPKKSLTTKNR